MLAAYTFQQGSFTPVAKGHAVTEASTMGLEPGYWPMFVAVLNANGDGTLFRQGPRIANGDELGGYTYYSTSGLRLDIFND